ncbi:MAG: hypothetical protein KDN19_07135 [Verrucomicrobiae bacterium]|nr:hypothetical protein [Verrucomicrobiae bacterium]
MLLGDLAFQTGAAVGGLAMGVVCGALPYRAAKKQEMPVTGTICCFLSAIIGLIGGLLFALPAAVILLLWVKIARTEWLGVSGILVAQFGVFAAIYYFTPELITIAETAPQMAESRTLTSDDGRTIEATVIAVDETIATIERADGQVFEIPIDRFSESDRSFIRSFGEPEAEGNAISRIDHWVKLADGEAYFTFFGLIPVDLYRDENH